MAAGTSYWYFSRFNLHNVNPPLTQLVGTLPVALSGPKTDWRRWSEEPGDRSAWTVGHDFLVANGDRSVWLFVAARWALIPLSVAGGLVCFLWAAELYGPRAGIVSTVLWCCCPNILGHCALLTADGGAAALGVAASYCFSRWLKQRSLARSLLAGLMLGLAALTKLTWIVLFVLWPVLWIACRWFGTRSQGNRKVEAGQLGGIMLLSLYVLNSGYAFEGSFDKLRNYQFVSETLAGARTWGKDRAAPGNRFSSSVVGSFPVPLPRNYVLGIDMQKRDFEGRLPSYLRGEWRSKGWWYYYVYGMAIKVPLGTWGLIAAAALLSLWSRRYRADWRNEIALLAPALVVLILVSSQTGFTNHFRYALPVLPYLYIFAGKATRCFAGTQSSLKAAVVGGLAWSVASSLAVYPHSLSYFNECVGGPLGGPAHMIDTNVDWGQDLLYLKRWTRAHPAAEPLWLAYNGPLDPRQVGIDAIPLHDGGMAGGPFPGWHALSITIIRARDSRCNWFLRFRPVATAGYSIYIYHITETEANRVRGEIGLPATDSRTNGSRDRRGFR